MRGRTFLVAHGAWSAGWAWKKMHPRMAAAGHRLITPTYTGLGEREHLANPSIDLETHAQDVLGVIKFEQLDDFVLIGHSYGGMVATVVADRVPDRISRLVYLDAFVPRDGQAMIDLLSAENAARVRAVVESGEWRVPSNPIPPDTPPEDAQWMQSLRLPQPVKTLQTPVRLRNGDTKIPRTYVYCTRTAPADPFRPFAERARQERWDYREIDCSHSAHITAPDALMELLSSVAS
ncbi:MAG TPA: alpha/beta hydrolase [Steroidobacteraceae bacterium]|nr:alpha/beta hydrolase [Steroidobacteraceae bacterium]